MHPSKRLFIIGAGDFGREMESLLEMIPENERDWRVAGYVDDSLEALQGLETDHQVLGRIDDMPFGPDDVALLAVSDPASREEVYGRLRSRVTFISYVHPNAVVLKFVRIGEGSIVVSNCVLSCSVSVGRFAIVNQGTQIGHDSTIGDFCSLMSSVDLGGRCGLEQKVFIGTGATLIPGIHVGMGARIGSGSVVIRNVKAGTTVFGNPAKAIS